MAKVSRSFGGRGSGKGEEDDGDRISVEPVEIEDGLVPSDLGDSQRAGRLRGDKVLVPDGIFFYERGGFGEPTAEEGAETELSAEEALYLFKKGKLSIVTEDGKSAATIDELLSRMTRVLPDIYIRFQVYADLRDRGYVVRSGLKYGTHFRVYDRGVKPKRGEREEWEHAKFLAHGIPESAVYSIAELSRFVRLSHSVRKILWLAVVDGEGDTTYFQITRATP